MNNKNKMIKIARSLFIEEELQDLKNWYMYTLSGEWCYIVFTVRRSYMLALIMECITKAEMSASQGEFLTDAALFLQCGKLADEYRKYRRFPKILLCDDFMIHGRNINHIIEGLQENLFRILGNDYDKDEIEDALVKAIDIHVYIRTEGSLLLLGPYMRKLNYIRKEKPASWHQISNACSTLILRSNLTNDCYIYTEYLSDIQMEKIRNTLINRDGFVTTTYQNIVQYTKIFCIGIKERVKSVLSLRIIKNADCEGYRVAPFVFLPNLDDDETDALCAGILAKFPPKYSKILSDWKNAYDKRTFSEMVTLLFSDAVLKEFNRTYEIIPDKNDQEQELIKLTRNYNQFGFEFTKQMLTDLLTGNSILTTNDINEIVNTVISDDRIVLSLAEGNDLELTDYGKKNIRRKLEDYFYKQGCIDEQAAYELLKRPYYQTKLRSKRRARGSCFTLKELNQGLTWQESEYCIAYFLQMMDSGVGSLNSYAPNDVKVIGYVQFVKPGEQSLLLKPLQLYEYMPMLTRMQLECERRLRILTDEIREFGIEAGWSKELISTLTEFADILREMGHTPKDWSGNYMEKIDENERNLYVILEKKSLLRQQYINYADRKYRYR